MNPRPMKRGYTRTPVIEEPAVPTEVTTAPIVSSTREHTSRELYDIVMARISNGETVPDARGRPVTIHSADDAYVYVFPERRGNGDKSRCAAMPIEEFCKDMKWVS